MILARAASWAALLITLFNAARGVALWPRLAVFQRWMVAYFIGSAVIGLAMAVTALMGMKNWGGANAWSAWIAVTACPALMATVGPRERRIGRIVILGWLAFWIALRCDLGMGGWDDLAHPILCGLLLGFGAFAFDGAVRRPEPFFRNPQAVLVVALSLMAASDCIAWAGIKHLSDHAEILNVWTARNLLMVPVAALFSWTIQ